MPRGELGRKVEVLIRDDKLKGDEAARRAKELLESEGVHLMAGVLSAPNQLAVNEQCKFNGIPYISTSQSNEIAMRPDNSIYTYHEAFDPFQTAQAVRTVCWKKLWEKMVLFDHGLCLWLANDGRLPAHRQRI